MPRKPPTRAEDLDWSATRTYPIEQRPSLVAAGGLASPLRAGLNLREFLETLPDFLAARDLLWVANELARRRRQGKRILLGLGAHVIKVGLSPLVIDLMERKLVDGIAVNGAVIVHDFELAFAGMTSEDVASHIADGRFGMARETGDFLNRAIAHAAPGEGLGHAVGRALAAAKLRHPEVSILAAAYRLGVPVTVHVAVGTDIIHMHPDADGAAIGRASLDDFRHLVALVAGLDGGAFVLLGSAVILPEVFVKAVSLARNLGHRVSKLLAVNLDFLRHYRPHVNVLQRPTAPDGRGVHITGHHEILFPLLCAAWLEAMHGPLARTRPRKTGRRSAQS
ncbi:MAG: hypothetical protein KatS3mg077_2109 [Candidatus Binatia bacterium]|nr:MAG: hypothetical protein KatS3mg077_2109 [Candidatus Binatia bacterium]